MKEPTYRSSVTLTAKEHKQFKRWLAKQRLSINAFLRSKIMEAIANEQK